MQSLYADLLDWHRTPLHVTCLCVELLKYSINEGRIIE